MEKTDYRELAAKLFCFLVAVFVGFLFLKYLLGYFIPFIIAWTVAYFIYPWALELSKKTKLPRKVCSFFMTLILLVLILSLLFLIVNRLVYELQDLVSYLNENTEKIANYFKSAFDFMNSIGERLPIINKLQNAELVENITQNINKLVEGMWQSLLADLGSAVPDIAAKIVMTLPHILFVGLIGAIACFYFALDIDLFHAKLKQILPEKIARWLKQIKNKFTIGFKKYIKAYLVLFAITFGELFVGFLILGVDYSFILAILIALIDFLPVFGTGAILAPWAAVALLMKNYFLGIGMFVLFIIITVVRQIIEPKILGKSLGVHPLLTLVAIYIGLEAFGAFGMIFLPIVTLLLFAKDEKTANDL